MRRLAGILRPPRINIVQRHHLVPHVPTRKRLKRTSRWFG
jgi:hypothetical protein